MSQTDDSGRVADAPSQNWVYRVLPRGIWPYAQLARWDRPIGWQLLLLPCLWSAALAANVAAAAGAFSGTRLVWHLILFFIGAVAMRGAGCTYNDLVDHEIDQAMARTRSGRMDGTSTGSRRAASGSGRTSPRGSPRLDRATTFGRRSAGSRSTQMAPSGRAVWFMVSWIAKGI